MMEGLELPNQEKNHITRRKGNSQILWNIGTRHH